MRLRSVTQSIARQDREMLKPDAMHPAFVASYAGGILYSLGVACGRLAWLAPPRRSATARDADLRVSH